MVIDMLEAVSEMLSTRKEVDAQSYFVKIECAKTILDKVIEGMKRESFVQEKFNAPVGVEILQDKPTPPKKHTPSPVPEGQYQIVMNPDLTIKQIVNLPLEGAVVIDGVTMTHREAIGKSYNTVSIP